MSYLSANSSKLYVAQNLLGPFVNTMKNQIQIMQKKYNVFKIYSNVKYHVEHKIKYSFNASET